MNIQSETQTRLIILAALADQIEPIDRLYALRRIIHYVEILASTLKSFMASYEDFTPNQLRYYNLVANEMIQALDAYKALFNETQSAT